jgi:tRNA pseudouridine55 synthase
VEPFGFLVVDKPRGMTSHDIVASVRRGTGVKGVGHAGTLDPMATGVLVVCLGGATRLSEYVMASDKLYSATVRLGIETDTYDAEGKTTAAADTSHLTRADIEAALMAFQGQVLQVPPMYSAIKQGGEKLYELARQGKEVKRNPRHVRLETQLVDVNLPDVRLLVKCSPGTYIRSIAHDLGATLGVGAHLIELRRLASGALDEPIRWDMLFAAIEDGTWQQYMIDERKALPNIPALHLSHAQTWDVQHGRPVPRSESDGDVKLQRAYDPMGQFLAIMEKRKDRWHPIKVFTGGS